MTTIATSKPPESRAVPSRAPSRLRRYSRHLWRFTVSIFAIVGLVTVVQPFLFDLTPMVSGSMSPTLQGDRNSGDWVLAEKVSYWFRKPSRWEIVEFYDAEHIRIMKRVIALPGESIAIEQNRVKVNGSFTEKPPGTAKVKYYPYGNLNGGRTHPGDQGYYVLGDDSIDSQDSRFDGTLTPDRIRARAWFIVWPLNRFGWVR